MLKKANDRVTKKKINTNCDVTIPNTYILENEKQNVNKLKIKCWQIKSKCYFQNLQNNKLQLFLDNFRLSISFSDPIADFITKKTKTKQVHMLRDVYLLHLQQKNQKNNIPAIA